MQQETSCEPSVYCMTRLLPFQNLKAFCIFFYFFILRKRKKEDIQKEMLEMMKKAFEKDPMKDYIQLYMKDYIQRTIE